MNETLAVSGLTPGLSLLKLVGALLLVLLAFWAFARVMKRFNVTRTGAAGGIEIVASVSVGPRERLVVLEAGEERIVLGVTAQTITRVHAMTVDAAAASGESGAASPTAAQADAASCASFSGAAFADRLRAALVGGAR